MENQKEKKIISLISQGKIACPYYLILPKKISENMDILVSVHGVTRNAIEHCVKFARNFPLDNIVFVAPLFSKERFKKFQILGKDTDGYRPDQALNEILKEIRSKYNINTGKIILSGYSGGGQFAHRYAMIYPQEIKKLVLMAPGWYTFPDENIEYPEGIGANSEFADLVINPANLLDIPINIIIGKQDIKRDSLLNRKESIDKNQGRNRIERSQNWVKSMMKLAIELKKLPEIKLNIIPNAAHSFKVNFSNKHYVRIVNQAIFANNTENGE